MTIDPRVSTIQDRLRPWRNSLLGHPLYARLGELSALHGFLQHHVFAVWDFMSLLKALQRGVCCVTVPWLPPANSATVRFLNEIAVGEECDVDRDGGLISHFELYHRAMRRCGADTSAIDALLTELRQGNSVSAALSRAHAPQAVRRFVEQTFSVIDSGDVCAMAAAFTFGREDLLPGVFQKIVDGLNVQFPGRLEDLKYYLQRHIEVDGGEHGPMAPRLITFLCGDDDRRWEIAARAAEEALQSRLELWDGILSHLQERAAA